MNRKPDGSLLTNEDLFDIAVKDGADSDKLRSVLGSLHGHAMQRSHLTFITAQARFNDPTLKLDTRNVFTPAAVEPIDPELIQSLRKEACSDG